MERIFYNKKTAILFVVAVLVVVLLVCMLLTTLTQMSTMTKRAEELNTLIQDAKTSGEALQQLQEYLKTDEYVMEWAEQNGLIDKNDIAWIQNELGNK